MSFNISADARPQIRTLLSLTALSLVLWFIPYADALTYPFRIFVTFIHEGGHALAALLTGNAVSSLSVAPDTSGLTYSTHSGAISQTIISSAGYVGATAYGALLLFLIRRTVAARFVLLGTAGFILTLTLIFGLVTPLVQGPGGSVTSIPFTLLAGLVLAGGLVAIALWSSPRVATLFMSFLAVQCVLNALLDLKTIFFMSAPFAPNLHSDAANMEALTGVPRLFWALMWMALSFVILSLALRAYAVRRDQKTEQRDLPFEDPLGV